MRKAPRRPVARRLPKRKAQPLVGKTRARKEHTEQVILVNRVRQFYPDVIIAAVPNGGWRKATEARRLKAEGVLPGFPDLIVMEPRGMYHGLVIEMKRIGGRTSPQQDKLLPRLKKRPYKVLLADQGADIAFQQVEQYLRSGESFLDRFLRPPRRLTELLDQILG